MHRINWGRGHGQSQPEEAAPLRESRIGGDSYASFSLDLQDIQVNLVYIVRFQQPRPRRRSNIRVMEHEHELFRVHNRPSVTMGVERRAI